MSYFCIFPDSTEFPIPLYPILGILLSLGLYMSLFQFSLQKVIEQLFSLTTAYGHIERTIIYLFIINFPIIALIISCLVYNHSLVGLLISIDIDILQILILGSYICYVQQSRQTPLCGFLFIRDLIIISGFIGAVSNIFLDGKTGISYGFILLGLYFFYYISLLFEQKLEDNTLKLLKLKDNQNYSSNYLLTQRCKQADFLGIKQTINSHNVLVKEDVEQFRNILNNVVVNLDQKQILSNFAKLFIPYVTAIKIKQKEKSQFYEKIYQEEFSTQQVSYQNKDQSFIDQEYMKDDFKPMQSFDKSDSDMLNRNTLTDDFIVQEDINKIQTTFDTALKYAFYPIYLISFVSGRLRYLLDYVSFFLMLGSMWVLGNSSYYFVHQTGYYCYIFVSLPIAGALIVPSSRHYLKISQFNDFDFYNMFLQSAIIKVVIFGVAVTVLAFIDPQFSCQAGIGLMLSVILSILTLISFGILMIGQKFATLKSNFSYVMGITVVSYFARIIIEVCFNLYVTL